MTNSSLQKKVQQLTNEPGVYQMMNDKGQIIYVGKARDLKKRVSSYFRLNQAHVKTQALMKHVVDIEFIITSSENAALILEADLIKRHRPRYNVLLRDDKSYPYLYLSAEDKFPRLDFYRGSKNLPGRFFGPYPSSNAARQMLNLLQRLFKVRQCSDVFFSHRTRPCLQYQIQRCTAPCVNYVSVQDYTQQVEYTKLFLEGKNDQVVEALQDKMQKASEQLAFEEAAFYRNQIAELNTIRQPQHAVVQDKNIDVIGIAESSGRVAISVVYIRLGRVLEQRTFFPSVPKDSGLDEVLEAFLLHYYLTPWHSAEKIDGVVVPARLADKEWMESALREKLHASFRIIDRRLLRYRDWQYMANANAQHALSQDTVEQEQVQRRLTALQKVLGLSNAIERIECFDVSHTQGEATVASCVVYGVEGPLSSLYRRFNITGVTPGDDYAAMRQALLRRYTRLKQEGSQLPDLIIIDGGAGQLKQALDVVEELQLASIELLGVAKGVSRKPGLEQLIRPKQKTAICLMSDDPALHLIQFIRDEAHRFAIMGHRKQRSKKRQQSVLETIPGVGPKRRQKLIQHFGGWQGVQKASVSDLQKVLGISEKLAEKIYQALH